MHHFLSSTFVFVSWFHRFHDYASALDVSAIDLYTALLADAELEPLNWNLQGRQANAWKLYSGCRCLFWYKIVMQIEYFLSDYIPQDVIDPEGMNTRQVSRTLEVDPIIYFSHTI